MLAWNGHSGVIPILKYCLEDLVRYNACWIATDVENVHRFIFGIIGEQLVNPPDLYMILK